MQIEDLITRAQEAMDRGATDIFVTDDCDIVFTHLVGGQNVQLDTIPEDQLHDEQ